MCVNPKGFPPFPCSSEGGARGGDFLPGVLLLPFPFLFARKEKYLSNVLSSEKKMVTDNGTCPVYRTAQRAVTP
jgi:hypothetical protein